MGHRQHLSLKLLAMITFKLLGHPSFKLAVKCLFGHQLFYIASKRKQNIEQHIWELVWKWDSAKLIKA